jgi:hypothetical protein
MVINSDHVQFRCCTEAKNLPVCAIFCPFVPFICRVSLVVESSDAAYEYKCCVSQSRGTEWAMSL